VVTVDQPWNRFEGTTAQRTPTWTHEGFAIDTLQFYVGIKDGEPIVGETPKGQKPPVFKASLPPADLVGLFQSLWTRDGSTFTLERIEPQPFVGADGFRFEYSMVRKADELRLQGVAWAAVRNGELYAIDFSAPRLGFFARFLPGVEAIARSARVRSPAAAAS
jgi:hypothetical protein